MQQTAQRVGSSIGIALVATVFFAVLAASGQQFGVALAAGLAVAVAVAVAAAPVSAAASLAIASAAPVAMVSAGIEVSIAESSTTAVSVAVGSTSVLLQPASASEAVSIAAARMVLRITEVLPFFPSAGAAPARRRNPLPLYVRRRG
jgi:hypothetical protein